MDNIANFGARAAILSRQLPQKGIVGKGVKTLFL
jgi:hypothetical protein